MPAYPREEMEEMVERWLQANRDAEAAGDWKRLGDMFHEDATYGWNYGPEGRLHDRGPRRRSATSRSAWRWAASTAGSTRTRRS